MFYVYILSSISRTIYVGVTNNLYERIKKHKSKENRHAFTAKYNISRLVYFEEHESVQQAIEREKQIKRWRRNKKIKLIESVNPAWKDLSREAQFSKG